MPPLLHRLVALLPSREGSRLDRRLRMTNTRRVQFASYLESSGARMHQVDRYERRLQWRQRAKLLLLGAAGGGLAWVVIESARAMTLF